MDPSPGKAAPLWQTKWAFANPRRARAAKNEVRVPCWLGSEGPVHTMWDQGSTCALGQG